MAVGKHPHERGEDMGKALLTILGLETPPRAWGRLRLSGWGNFDTEKHPHERGEDYIQL